MAVPIVAGALFGTSGAVASPITLGSAANYGILLGNDYTVTMSNVTVSGGSIAVGTFNTSTGSSPNPDSFTSITSNGFVEGDWGHNCSPSNTSKCTSSYGPTGSPGTITQGATTSAMFSTTTSGDPLADAIAANSAISNAAATSLGSITSSQTITLATAGDHFFSIANLSLSSGACLTLDDGSHAGAKFVIDVTGGFSLGTGACIKLQSLTTAADVIFNIDSSNTSAVSITGSSTFAGTLLAPNNNVTITGGTITGEIIAGFNNVGKSYTMTGSPTVTFQAYVPSRAPEPASLGLFCAGTAAIAFLNRRRTRRNS